MNPRGQKMPQADARLAADDVLDDEAILASVLEPFAKGFEEDLKGTAQMGAAWLLNRLLDGLGEADARSIDDAVKALDEVIGDQVDAILKHEDLRRLEAAWRGVKFLVDRTDFRQNIEISLLNVTKAELAKDLKGTEDHSTTSLYRHLYSANLGSYGGKPFAAMIGNYEFDTRSDDVGLLRSIAAVAAMAHAPFIAAASSKAFGISSFQALEHAGDIADLMKGDQFIKWRSLRETENARYIALTLPRFVLRQPYTHHQVESFKFTEPAGADAEDYLWGNAAFAFASRLTGSFADSGWCANIIGPKSGGRVDNLPVHVYPQSGRDVGFAPLEVALTHRREYEFAEAGFMPLVLNNDKKDEGVFFSAQSIQKPKIFGTSKEDKQAEFNYRLSTQLPYMFIISRLAHYVKAIQAEEIGGSLTRQGLEKKLDTWLRQYVSTGDNPSADIVRRFPLRDARIEVLDVEGEPGWYRVNMAVTPHYKYQGAYFTLSLSGRLEKK